MLAVIMGYWIEEASPSHLAALIEFMDRELRKDYFMPRRQLEHVLTGRYHMTYLAVEKHHILGVAIISLVNLLVAACERKRGLGSALLRACRCEIVRAKIDVTSGDPRDFYASRGYRRTGEFNRKRNIEIMCVDIDSPPEHFSATFSPDSRGSPTLCWL